MGCAVGRGHSRMKPIYGISLVYGEKIAGKGGVDAVAGSAAGIDPTHQARLGLKDRYPLLVPLVRAGRLVLNQFRYPGLATALDLHGQVMAGPFKGLRLRCSGISFDYFEALGVHEQCLYPVIEDVIARQPEVVINVGAAFGYYALGFARRLPGARVVAFELDESRAAFIRRWAQRNRLGARVSVRGLCTLEELQACLTLWPGAFVLMDIEGAEDALLDPEAVPGLRKAKILVEVHENFVPGVTGRLKRRFEATHDIALVRHQPNQKLEDYGWADWLVRRYWDRAAAGEHDGEMAWLHMRPKLGSSAHQGVHPRGAVPPDLS